MPSTNARHRKEFVYDFAVLGGVQGAIQLKDNLGNAAVLPVGSIVTDVLAVTETIVTSGGSATLALGNVTTADKYVAATAKTSFDAVGEVAVNDKPNAVSPQNLVANDLPVKITIGTADLTAGKVRFIVGFDMPSSQAVASVG